MSVIKPLAGVKIVELSTVVTASLATMLLTEQGAETVKVEPVGVGDTLRYLGGSSIGVSPAFLSCNRGKQSLALDLKSADGMAIVEKLIANADVVISNYRPGVLDRLGIGSAAMREKYPQLIYVEISGYGSTGPMANSPAYDHVIQAATGFTGMQGLDGDRQLVKTFVCDEITAYTAAQAMTAALLHRANTGAGQHIELSMMESCLYFLWPGSMIHQTLPDEETSGEAAYKHTYRTMRTKDSYVVMAALMDAHWSNLFALTGRDDLASDPRFATTRSRIENIVVLYDKFSAVLAEMTTQDVLALFAKADVPIAECLAYEDVLSHPQIVARESVKNLEHPKIGTLAMPVHPAHFGGEAYDPLTPIFTIGEHTREVLLDLGYSTESIATLAADGVVAVGD